MCLLPRSQLNVLKVVLLPKGSQPRRDGPRHLPPGHPGGKGHPTQAQEPRAEGEDERRVSFEPRNFV